MFFFKDFSEVSKEDLTCTADKLIPFLLGVEQDTSWHEQPNVLQTSIAHIYVITWGIEIVTDSDQLQKKIVWERYR